MNNIDGCNEGFLKSTSLTDDDDSSFDNDLSPITRILMAQSLAVMGTGKLKFREDIQISTTSSSSAGRSESDVATTSSSTTTTSPSSSTAIFEDVGNSSYATTTAAKNPLHHQVFKTFF